MNIAKTAKNQIKLRCKREGTPIVLTWTELVGTPPAIDPTSGARLSENPSAVIGSSRSCTTKCFIHFVQPVTSGYRRFAEMEAGDAIVDCVFDLFRISDAGDTALVVGEVVDELTLNAANRNVGAGDVAIGTQIEAHTLSSLQAQFGGRFWVQKEIGEELAANWDTLYANVHLNRALLLRLQ